MDASSLGFILKLFNWLLNKAGYKIVPSNDWVIEEINIPPNFADQDPASVGWADKPRIIH